LTYYAYGAFPVFFWEDVFARKQALASGYRILFEKIRGVKGFSLFAIEVVLFMAILQALVRSLLHLLLPHLDILLTRIRYNHTSTEQFSPYATSLVPPGHSLKVQSFSSRTKVLSGRGSLGVSY
jgi:hypothetical protein